MLFNDNVRRRLVPGLVSYAVGTLLGVALLALLPEALKTITPSAVFGTLLAGILVFFILEKLELIHHCHTDECQVHSSTAALVIIGDAFQISSTAPSSAVLTSVPLASTRRLPSRHDSGAATSRFSWRRITAAGAR